MKIVDIPLGADVDFDVGVDNDGISFCFDAGVGFGVDARVHVGDRFGFVASTYGDVEFHGYFVVFTDVDVFFFLLSLI